VDGASNARRGAGASVVVLVTALAGCTSPVLVGESLLPCVERGRVGGVGVDLAQVLSTEGGDYWAEVSVPSLDAVDGLHFAGNDVYYPYGAVEAPLTDDPVEVHVSVITGRGGTAYEASTVVDPELVTTTSAECDGVSSYRAGLVAVPGEGLVPHEEGTPVTDARGRWSAAVWTEQGVYSYRDEQGTWRRVGGRLDDGACGYPPGWHTNGQRGWMSVQPDGLLLFEDERGHVERFERAPAGWEPEPCAAGPRTG
jgi:hypothetical protein